mgnify:FL=1
MTSKIKVDNISKVSDDSNIISKCGTAISVGASGNTVAVTGNDIRSDSYKAADGGVIVSQSGTTITLGASGDTVTLASGASQSGFGRTGTVDWQTGSIKTSTFTAANGEGYFANTSGGAFTMNLPAGSAGAIVAVSDYASSFASNNLTISPNGSENINGGNFDLVLSTSGISLTFVYVDATRGWKNVNDGTTNATGQSDYITATGGTITTSGDYKIHTFTGPGTFCVSGGGTAAPCSGSGSNVVDYLVVAGAGGGGSDNGGGGGAGGYRESPGTANGSYTVSPLGASPAVALAVPAGGYPITVGAGGTGGSLPSSPGVTGGVSTFSTITSAGGGGGSGDANNTSQNPGPGSPGGSGGGGAFGANAPVRAGGNGNVPPVSPPQGQDGAAANPNSRGGGGGGATGGGIPGGSGGAGGSGATSSINTTPTSRATGGTGGPSSAHTGASGPANSGTGGSGPGPGGATLGGNGGSGIVILRYKYQN